MSQDYSYFGFSYINRNAENGAKNTTALNNAADISVIVVYFLVVLAVGVWVSFAITFKTNFFLNNFINCLQLRRFSIVCMLMCPNVSYNPDSIKVRTLCKT